jgi:hypothetical protein
MGSQKKSAGLYFKPSMFWNRDKRHNVQTSDSEYNSIMINGGYSHHHTAVNGKYVQITPQSSDRKPTHSHTVCCTLPELSTLAAVAR